MVSADALVVSSAVAIAAGLAVVLIQAKYHRRRSDQLEHKVARLEQQLQTALSGAIGMGHRIVSLEKRLQQLSSNQVNHRSVVDEFAYGQALQMFDQGADVATVASNCGFSNSEAQLMALVQQQLKKPSKNSPEGIS